MFLSQILSTQALNERFRLVTPSSGQSLTNVDIVDITDNIHITKLISLDVVDTFSNIAVEDVVKLIKMNKMNGY